jgi:acetolactate decarboxylase
MFGKRLVPTLLLILLTLPTACIAPLPEANRDTLFQTSTLSALSAGNFDGAMTIAELKRHGDFGLGTYNALDGEMVVLEGQVYQVRDDGVPQLAEDSTQTPFAAVTFFEADQSLDVNETFDCVQLQAHLDSLLPTLNAPYAMKVSGEFDHLKVRAPHKESQPYPALTDALADQAIFESQNISGSLVGFRLPDYLAGANSAGYHFHFISADRQAGGHVLECQADAWTVEIDFIDDVTMDLSPSATGQATTTVTAQTSISNAVLQALSTTQ